MDSHTPWDLPRLPDRVGRLRALLIIHFRDSTLLVGCWSATCSHTAGAPMAASDALPTGHGIDAESHAALGAGRDGVANEQFRDPEPPSRYAGLDEPRR